MIKTGFIGRVLFTFNDVNMKSNQNRFWYLNELYELFEDFWDEKIKWNTSEFEIIWNKWFDFIRDSLSMAHSNVD